jgi:glycosyltransferase involved in cell wall biosynthesis
VRILLVGDYPDDPRLGSAKVYHKLRDEFRALGHACDVLFAPDLGPRPAGMRVRWLLGPVLAERAVRRAFRARGAYDVVDAASAEGFVLGARRRAGAYRGVALVSRSHGLEHLNYRRMLDDARAGFAPKPWHRRIWYPASRLSQVAGAARLADRLIVLNEEDRRFALARGWKRADAVAVVPHGVSARWLADAPPPDAPRGAGILFCGTWTDMKGVRYLAEAFGLLRAGGSDARLTVLGPGVADAEVLGSFPEGARAAVTVLPRSDEEGVMRAFRAHALLAHPSTYEGFGLVIPEAMSQGLPVVATPQGCAPSLVRDGETGAVVPARDVPALAGALARLLADAPLRRALGERAREVVRPLSWEHTARRTLEVYAAALGA